MTTTRVAWTRLGPVYLWWSEWSASAVIGPEQGAWGGSDIWRCDLHPDWRGGEGYDESPKQHAWTHKCFIHEYTTTGTNVVFYA